MLDSSMDFDEVIKLLNEAFSVSEEVEEMYKDVDFSYLYDDEEAEEEEEDDDKKND